MRTFLSLILIWVSSFGYVFAQVTIAPTNLFVNANTGFGTYMVINNSDQNQEVSISFFYAYSSTDDEGVKTIVTNDTLSENKYSIADRIRAFPQNFILEPNQRQVVRLRVGNTQDLSDGTYWARISTRSSAQSPPVEINTEDEVRAQLGINFEQVTGVFYKKGNVRTGIEVEEIRTEISDDGNLIIFSDIARVGNSPFLGSITNSLINEEQVTVLDGFVSTSIYFDGTHRHEFDISELPAGKYTVEVRFESERSDISPDDLVQMQPVTATTTVTIP